MTSSSVRGLLAWLALCFCAAGTAAFVGRDGWYSRLHQPAWGPPGWLFAPVWTVLYVLMAVAAWLIWRDGGWKKHPHALWLFLLQLLLNALWTPLFFGLHRIGLAFAELLLLWLVLAITRRAFLHVNPQAGALLLPYLMWLSFAAALNYALWRLNG